MMLLPKIFMPQSNGFLVQHGRAALIAAVLALGFAFIASPAQAAIRYVTTTGVDTGDCSFEVSPCATITYAVGKAGAGDDIRVASGTYTELEIGVSKDVTITGGFDASGPTQWETS